MNEKKETNINFGNVNYESLQHYDLMLNCLDIVRDDYQLQEGDYYRVVHCPIDINDNLAQRFQKFDSLVSTSISLPEQIANNAPIDEKRDFLKDLALSFNVSYESLEQFALYNYNKRKSITSRDLLKNKWGKFIVKVHITPECGLVEKNIGKDGHVNILPFEGFDLSQLIDKEFGYKEIEFED